MATMPPIDRLVQLIFDEQLHLQRRESHADRVVPPPLVALTHDYGSGGEVIGRSLAKALGVEFMGDDVTYREGDACHLEALILQRLAKTGDKGENILAAYLAGGPAVHEMYRRTLVSVLLDIAQNRGGVIVDRGAHLILRERAVFRVRIVGSEEVCARRVAEREGCDESSARDKVRKINQQRMNYLRALVGTDQLDPRYFDVTLNTDHFPHLDEVYPGLIGAMRAMGLNTGRA